MTCCDLHGWFSSRLARPRAYQVRGGYRQRIPAPYVLRGPHRVSLAMGAYDPRRPLVIDPVPTYATYLGGTGLTGAAAVAVDRAENAYVAGATAVGSLPSAGATVRLTRRGGGQLDAFVAELDPTGTMLLALTYLGGSGSTTAYGVAVDGAGRRRRCGWPHAPAAQSRPARAPHAEHTEWRRRHRRHRPPG